MNDTFTLTLMLDINNNNNNERNYLDKVFYCANKLNNIAVKEARKRINKYKEDPIVNALSKKYHSNEKLSKEDWNILHNKQTEYNLSSKYCLEEFLSKGRNKYKNYVNSTACANIADQIYNSVKKYLFSNGKEIHFKKYKDFKSISAKTIKGCILFDYEELSISYMKHKYKIKLKNNDNYAKECFKNNIKYCRIKRKWHKHNYRYYVEIVFEGIPPLKRISKNQSVGIDLGTSTIAISTKDKLIFKELNDDIASIDKEIRVLNRKADRQRRVNNPDNYNKDGTIKRNTKNFKKKWIISKSNRLTYDKIKYLYQKRSNRLLNFQHHLANEVISCGNLVKIEKMNISSLAKKSKKTEISKKTKKFKKKKRFGKSIQIHAPAQLIELINMKLKYQGGLVEKINTKKVKASQFNHLTGEFKKPELNQRWKFLDKDTIVQRDLYSAFLIEHIEDKEKYDIDNLINDFKGFKEKHDLLLKDLYKQKLNGKTFPSCMGIEYKYISKLI